MWVGCCVELDAGEGSCCCAVQCAVGPSCAEQAVEVAAAVLHDGQEAGGWQVKQGGRSYGIWHVLLLLLLLNLPADVSR